MIDESDADLIVLPELGLSGYTCGDLFATEGLLGGCLEGTQGSGGSHVRSRIHGSDRTAALGAERFDELCRSCCRG